MKVCGECGRRFRKGDEQMTIPLANPPNSVARVPLCPQCANRGTQKKEERSE